MRTIVLLLLLSPLALAQDTLDLTGVWKDDSGRIVVRISQSGNSVTMDLENGIQLNGKLEGRNVSLSYKWTEAEAAKHIKQENETGPQAAADRAAALKALVGSTVTVSGTVSQDGSAMDATYREQEGDAATQGGQTSSGTKQGASNALRLTRVTHICGPDVTRQVLAVMVDMRDTFEHAKSDEQDEACSTLVRLKTAEYAWDILELFQQAGSFPSDKDPYGSPSRWESLSGNRCCRPRYPCGKTVQFFGACHDMQVVNYVMWGMTEVLCKDHLGINSQQAVAAWARNRKSPDRPEQELMTQIGEKYGAEIVKVRKYQELVSQGGKANRDELEGILHEMPPDEIKRLESFKTIGDAADPARFPELQQLVANQDKNSSRTTKPCATICTHLLSADQITTIKNMRFTYRWVGLTKSAPGRR
jgi:hypothetical protein